jgi:hypothetical protein
LSVAYRCDNRSRGKKSGSVPLRAAIVKGDYHPVARIRSCPEPLIINHTSFVDPKPNRSEIINDYLDITWVCCGTDSLLFGQDYIDREPAPPDQKHDHGAGASNSRLYHRSP